MDHKKNKPDAHHYLYDQVAELVIDMIDNGTLRPGERVPSLRQMSKQLDVSIATVTQAYVNLEDRGLIESRPQSGYYVRVKPRRALNTPTIATPRPQPRKVSVTNTVETIFSLAHQSSIVPLGLANPSPELLPSKGLARALKSVMTRKADYATSYTTPLGLLELRRMIAFRSADIGCHLNPDDIVITTGATEALAACLKAVAKPGDVIAVPTPVYFSILQMIENFGMLAMEIDTCPEHGMKLPALEKVLDNTQITAVVNVGNFSNPTGSLMPDKQKEQLVKLLAERKIPLIEDDVAGDLYFTEHRPRTCKSFDEEGLVLSASSFSKTLAPGYRIGWVIPGQFKSEVLLQKQLSTAVSPSVTQLAVSEFLREGHYDRHLRRLRRAFKDQLTRLTYAVSEYFPEGTRVTQPRGGFVLWVQLPQRTDANELYALALAHGTSFAPGVLFAPTEKYKNCIRLCANHPWDDRIERAVQILGEIIHANMGK